MTQGTDFPKWEMLYKELAERAREKGYSIRYANSDELKDYLGMNDLAGKAMGYPELKKKEIILKSHMTWEQKFRTLRHEVYERGKMAKGKDYWSAHNDALKFEEYVPKSINDALRD